MARPQVVMEAVSRMLERRQSWPLDREFMMRMAFSDHSALLRYRSVFCSYSDTLRESNGVRHGESQSGYRILGNQAERRRHPPGSRDDLPRSRTGKS
jgi:hypothetical protein